MAYEKVMGLPHPNLQTRRLKRLQKEQVESLGKGIDLLNKKSYASKKTSQLAKGTEIMLNREQIYNTTRESINTVSNDLSEDPKTSSNNSIDVDEDMLLHRTNRRHKPSYPPTCNISSSSTNDTPIITRNKRQHIRRY